MATVRGAASIRINMVVKMACTLYELYTSHFTGIDRTFNRGFYLVTCKARMQKIETMPTNYPAHMHKG